MNTRDDPVVAPQDQDNDKSNGFPLAEGMSLSHWLQGVRSDTLLDYRSSERLPQEAEVVIIGSGVRKLSLDSSRYHPLLQ
jgi:hypothetical protein